MNITNREQNTVERRSYSLTYNEHFIKIGTQNIKGFNIIDKQLVSFYLYRTEHLLDIIGITETKTKKNENKILSKNHKKNIINQNNNNIDADDEPQPTRDFNEYYQTWWSGKEENFQGAGVGLAIKKELATRVYKIDQIDGRALMADIQLKQKIKIRIIVLYMPADPKHEIERAMLITKIEAWIKQGLSDNKKIIVMGDLNADPDKLEILKKDYPKRKVKDKYKIISMLNNNRIFDSQIGINEKRKT